MIRTPFLVVTCFCALAAAVPAAGQTPDTAAARRFIEQQVGHPVSQQEILTRVRESGLTRAQARARLRQLGYDSTLLDPYYDAIEAGAAGSASADAAAFAAELQAMERAPRRPEPTAAADTVEQVAVEPAPVSEPAAELERFGRDLFTRATTEFQPIQYGPVDPGYRVGPGDEVQLVLTGGVESAYSLEVNRQGTIIVPEVGQVAVSGRTMDELDRVLRQRLGRVYSGLVGAEPTIQLQVSLGRLRTNQVFLLGEVERPGAYQVSAFATAFNALYQAGGPNEMGSFREVQVRRGDQIVGTIDLYDYLLYGNSRDDIRLDNGDRIHVPLVGETVTVTGAVRRPAIYELLPGEGLLDALGYAGGFTADAVVRQVQVDRILPPGQRRPGADRVLVDVDLTERQAFELEDGDVVHVSSVSGERRNRVTITGDVHRPGTYEWLPGTTLADLVARAEGLAEAAYTPRIHIYRLDEARGDRELISVSAEAALDDAGSVALADRDSVVVYSRAELSTPKFVHISGYVKEPGTYRLADGMTIEDLVLAAGGFRNGAHTTDAEVARVPADRLRTDTTAVVMRVGLAFTDSAADAAGVEGWDVPVWRPGASEFELRHADRVFVRKAPGYADARTVTVAGEVAFPGEYVLSRRQERLTDLLARAGGFTSEVYVPGIRIVRDGRLVAVNAEEALADPDSRLNIVLEAGDSLQVPQYDPTVLVLGAVNFESRVLYEPGKGLSYYIERAGGYRDAADREHVSVTSQNGERNTVRRFLMMQAAPEVTPGSTVFVPSLPPAELSLFNFDSLLTRMISVASVTATLLVAINQLK